MEMTTAPTFSLDAYALQSGHVHCISTLSYVYTHGKGIVGFDNVAYIELHAIVYTTVVYVVNS